VNAYRTRRKDGFAPVFFSGYIAGPDGAVLFHLQTEHFVSLSVSTTGKSAWTGTLSLVDRYGVGMSRAVYTPGQCTVVMRWRFDDPWSDDDTDALTYKGLIARPSLRFTAEGITADLELVGIESVDARLGAESVPREFAGKSASEVVEAICTAMSSLRPGTFWHEPVIQESDDYPTDWVIPSGQSHWDFINSTLLESACKAMFPPGESDRCVGFDPFVCYVDPRQNRLHFHTAKYDPESGSDTSYRMETGEYVVYADGAGDVISFDPEDAAVQALLAGGLSYRGTGVNSDDGRPVDLAYYATAGVERNPTTFDGAGVRTSHEEAVHAIDYTKQTANAKPVAGRTEQHVLGAARAEGGAATMGLLKADLTVKGTHDHSFFDIIYVRYFDHTGAKNYLSGFYSIVGIEHEVSGNGWTTRLSLVRSGFRRTTGATQQVGSTPGGAGSAEFYAYEPGDQES